MRQDTSTTNLAELDTPDWYRYSCAYDASMVSLKGTGYGSMACDASALQQNLLGDIAAINQTFLGIEWNDQTKQSLNQCRDHIARITAAEPEHNPGKHPYGEGRDVVDIYPALVGVHPRASCTVGTLLVCPHEEGGCGANFGYLKPPHTRTVWAARVPPINGGVQIQLDDMLEQRPDDQGNRTCRHCSQRLWKRPTIVSRPPAELILWRGFQGETVYAPKFLDYRSPDGVRHHVTYQNSSIIHHHSPGTDAAHYTTTIHPKGENTLYHHDGMGSAEGKSSIRKFPYQLDKKRVKANWAIATYTQLETLQCGYLTFCGQGGIEG